MAKENIKNDEYTVDIREVTKEVGPIEMYRLTDTNDAVMLQKATNDGPIIIDYDYHATVDVHNPKSKDQKDYTKYVIVDKAGQTYTTGSESFIAQLNLILKTLGKFQGWALKVFQVPSKNRDGQSFLTCSVEKIETNKGDVDVE